mmetsp:Transcript_8632/g.9836  ORF Transcript_8632/g.9836 Transcript_8632/m.9836 type:complete len:84 (+) Transcript_8632:215-466(+)
MDYCLSTSLPEPEVFALAFEQTNFNTKCVFSNDLENSSKVIYDLNHPNALTLASIQEVNSRTFQSMTFSVQGSLASRSALLES